MAVVPQGLTLDEFLKLPEAEPPLEYADGEVTQKVSPKTKHSALQAELTEYVNRVGRSCKIARAFPDLRATFAGRSRVPDVVVLRWERVPVDPDGRVTDEPLAPPDIAIEIVSPEQSVTSLIRKCAWYVANGVALAVLVDSYDESVLVFHPDGRLVVCGGADEIDFTTVIPEARLQVSALFAALRHE